MKAFIISSLLLLSLFGFAQKNSYTLHKVEKGQTLYGIAKLYSKSIEEIKKINAEVNFNALKYGQQIKIPSSSKPINPNTTPPATSTNGKTPLYNLNHIVKSGESAYSIAKMYAISIDLLIQTNKLSNTNVQIGQSLVIPGSSGTTTIVKQAEPGNTTQKTITNDSHSSEQTKSVITTKKNEEDIDITDPTINNLGTSSAPTKTVTKETVSKTDNSSLDVKNDIAKSNTDYKSESEAYNFGLINNKPLAEQFSSYTGNASLVKKTIKGVASYMKDASDTPSYIAMYNASPIGSVVKVKNLMNGHVIYVKVVGKLPDLDKNKDLNIKVSEAAAKALGVVDEKFLNEIEYFITK
jgi:LysM repeat protein/rare lipoprotein A (peptidoglycan hydrolase)